MDKEKAYIGLPMTLAVLRQTTRKLLDPMEAYHVDIILDRLDEEASALILAVEGHEKAPAPVAAGADATKKNDVITIVKDTPSEPEPSTTKDASRRLTDEEKMEIIRMLKDAVPVKEISEKTGVSVSNIYRIRTEVM